MSRRRAQPDGLPFRVYEYVGRRVYSIGHKGANGRWTFRLKCDVDDLPRRRELRHMAAARLSELDRKPETFALLIDAWFDHQEHLDDEARRASTTLAENRREAANLRKAFGHMRPRDIEKSDAYAYQLACERASRAAKGNKELSLLRLILEHGIKLRQLSINPMTDFKMSKTTSKSRLVSDAELALAVEVGRKKGGRALVAALALKVAYLCVRRSGEVLSLRRSDIRDEGVYWRASKQRKGAPVKGALIRWSTELRATIEEALSIERPKASPQADHVFGNLEGNRYTKGGWKSTLAPLMRACVEEARRKKVPFEPFSLQEGRPMGVTEKLAQAHLDVLDATMHSSPRMVQKVYDRRTTRKANPAK